MARTKWKNRTPEDKARIARETAAREQPKKKFPRQYAGLVNARDPEAPTQIYKNGALPVLCMEHGWVEGDHYILDNENPSPLPGLGGKKVFLHISTNCPKCKKKIHRIIADPLAQSDYLLVPMAIINLQKADRLTDNRTEDWR